MPWEKSFEESEVIDQVMEVFWEKGYAATSISDLTKATGIKRGSLYNAFDGKADLFMRSLVKYDQEQRQEKVRQFGKVADPRKAIGMFFDYVVQDALSDVDKKGCLLVNTSLELCHHSHDVAQVVREAFGDLSSFFESQIVKGQNQGQIEASIDARSTAQSLVATVVGIRVLGRGTFGKETLKQMAEQAQRLIC